jgi:hypothetical protein
VAGDSIDAPRPTATGIMSAVAHWEMGTGLRPWARMRHTADSLPSAAPRQESPATLSESGSPNLTFAVCNLQFELAGPTR